MPRGLEQALVEADVGVLLGPLHQRVLAGLVGREPHFRGLRQGLLDVEFLVEARIVGIETLLDAGRIGIDFRIPARCFGAVFLRVVQARRVQYLLARRNVVIVEVVEILDVVERRDLGLVQRVDVETEFVEIDFGSLFR